MPNLQHIQDGVFFQRTTLEFNVLITSRIKELNIHPTQQQEIICVKKRGDKLIIKLSAQGCLIRKLNNNDHS